MSLYFKEMVHLAGVAGQTKVARVAVALIYYLEELSWSSKAELLRC